MTVTTRTAPCLSTHALERLAECDVPPAPAQQLHIDACVRCRESLERARRENAFLMRHSGELRAAVLPPTPPESVPGYSIIRRLSSGGQGVVYEAMQNATNRRVAVKMLREGAFATDRQRFRFEREVEVLASLRHPNIVTVFDKGKTDCGLDFVAMEFIDARPINEHCKDLHTRARNEREFVRSCLALLATAAHAVQHAHSLGVMHRDLKPGNILVDRAGQPRVIDFGLARHQSAGDRGSQPTLTREFMGTSAYASPEQFSGNPEHLTVATDVYSLGVLMFEVLTGKFPYPVDGSPAEIERHARATEPLVPSSLNPSIPDDLDTIVLKALSKDPARRYATAGELAADIDCYLSARPISARPDSPLYRFKKYIHRHGVLVSAASALVITVAMWVGSIVLKNRDLTREQARTSEAVTDSRIRQARLQTRVGNTLDAEQLLWPELLRVGADPADPQLGFDSPSEVMRPVWALFEAYSRSPRLTTAHSPPAQSPGRLLWNSTRLEYTDDRGVSNQWLFQGDRLVALDRPAVTTASGSARLWPTHDRSFALAAESDGLVLLDRRTGDRLAAASFETSQLRQLVISPEDDRFATIDGSRAVVLWNTHTLEPLIELSTGADPGSPPCFSSDGETLAAIDRNGDALLWDLRTSAPPTRFVFPGGNYRQATGAGPALSRDRRWIACPRGSAIVLWPVDDPSCPIELTGHQAEVISCQFSPDSQHLLSTGCDRTARLWNVSASSPTAVLGPVHGLQSRAAFSQDGSLVAVHDSDSYLSVWEATPNAWGAVLSPGVAGVHTFGTSDNGDWAVSGNSTGRVVVWEVRTWRERARLDLGEAVCIGADVSNDGALVILHSSQSGGTLLQWDGADKPKVLAPARGYGAGVQLSPDQRTVAYVDDGNVSLYDVQRCEHRVIGGSEVPINTLAFDAKGQRLGSGASDGVTTIFDLATGERTQLIGHTGSVRALSFSPDSTTVATGGDDLTIRTWNFPAATLRRTLRPLPAPACALAFHPAGTLLFSACGSPEVTAWDPRTGAELATITGAGGVTSVSVGPDGSALITGVRSGQFGLQRLDHYQRHVRGNAALQGVPASRPAD